MFRFGICFILIVALASGSPKPKKGTDCYLGETDEFFGIGETIQPKGMCMHVVCDEPGTYRKIKCPPLDIVDNPNCKYIKESIVKDYPDCCEKCI